MSKHKKPDDILQADWDAVNSPEWTDEDFKRAKPAKKVLPEAVYNSLIVGRCGQTGPQKAPLKATLNLRVDPDVVEAYKATGAGWQTRMNVALRRGLKK